MENDKFIRKLIKGTKEEILEWKPAQSKKLYSSYQPFYLEKGDKKLVLEKCNTIEYDSYGEELTTASCMLSICDDNYNRLSMIVEEDLDKSTDLWRLYRLAERKVNKIDDIMESFVEDIQDSVDF
ncbi:MAG: hypothetical protein IJD40_10900 [Lachnospiraceae bacterium]|nr:hypothetical protein [Lachnospiraceae bacterium]